MWTHADPAGARSLPYADDTLAVFATAFASRVVALDARSGALRWQRELSGGPTGLSLPQANIVAVDSLVIVAAWQLYALDRASGQLRWTFAGDTDYAAGSSVAVEGDHIISPGSGLALYAVDAHTGSLIWRTAFGERPFAPVVDQGVVYVGARGYLDTTGTLGAGHVFAVRASDGQVLWSTLLPDAANGAWRGGTDHAGALTPNLFVVASTNGRIYGIDRQDGQVRWVYDGPGPFQSGVVILNGVAIAAALTGDIIGLDAASGAFRWRTTTGGSSVIVQLTTDGSCAYVSVGAIMCVDASGQVRWQAGGASNGGPLYFTAVRSVADRLYAGSSTGFHALAASR